MEAFFYRSPELYAIFLIEPGEYDAVRLWTVNVGFYNMLMGLGLIVGVVLREHRSQVVAGRAIVLYHTAMHVVLGHRPRHQRSRSSGSRRRRGRAGDRGDPRGDHRRPALASGCRGRDAGGDGYASPARSVSTVFSVSRVAASPWCTSSKLVESGDRPSRRPPGSR